MTRNAGTREVKPVRFDCPSLDEWLLSIVAGQEEHTVDASSRRLSEADWAQVVLVIDRLSRTGKIALWPIPQGDYRITLKATA